MKRMVRFTVLILLMVLYSIINSGCSRDSKSEPPSPSSGATRVITDMTGRQVEIPLPENIKRVAVQTSPQVLNAYAVGVPERICAVTNAVKRWPLLGKADPHLKDVMATRAGNAQINIEALLSTRPDVCIGSESDMRVIEKLTKLPTLRISMGTPGAYFESVKKEVAFFGNIFGKENRVKTFNRYLDGGLMMIRDATKNLTGKNRRKVYMGFDADHLTTYGKDTFMNEWIEASGCINAAGDIESLGGKEGGLRSVSMEQLVTWNPDIIIIDSGKAADLFDKPAWSAIRAVKDRRVYRLPVGLFLWNRPACEAAVLFPEWLATRAYPESFQKFDIKSHAAKFYHDVFGFDFSKDEIDQIFNQQAGENVRKKHIEGIAGQTS